MLKLTPFKETYSYQKNFQEDAHALLVDKLTKQTKRKFHLADKTTEKVRLRLVRLTLADLDVLFEDLMDMRLLRDLNQWLDDRFAVAQILAEMPLAA